MDDLQCEFKILNQAQTAANLRRKAKKSMLFHKMWSELTQ